MGVMEPRDIFVGEICFLVAIPKTITAIKIMAVGAFMCAKDGRIL